MYVKLFSSMLDSSIWAEDADTRVVWVTLLLMSDPDGHVRASPTALARRANVPLAACRKALETLAAPDLESGTQEYGGRRIEPIEGGWLVLNKAKYRDMKDAEHVRALTRERVRRHRERLKQAPETPGALPPATGNAEETPRNAPKPYKEEEEEEEIPTLPPPTEGVESRPERPRTWQGDAAEVLRAAGVPEGDIADSIRNFWAAARRRFTDAEIAAVVREQGAYFRARGTTAWNPAKLWNPRNSDFDDRFRYRVSQAKALDLKHTREAKGLDTLAHELQRRGLVGDAPAP